VVEFVSVAERLEVMTTKTLLLRAGSRHTAERSEAWRGFCHPGTSIIRSTSVGTILIEAGKLSRYRLFVRDTGAVVVQAVSEPEICHGAGIILRVGAGALVDVLARFVLGAECRKNHDKLINLTVRVGTGIFNSVN
jgi:hypothetical protein